MSEPLHTVWKQVLMQKRCRNATPARCESKAYADSAIKMYKVLVNDVWQVVQSKSIKFYSKGQWYYPSWYTGLEGGVQGRGRRESKTSGLE